MDDNRLIEMANRIDRLQDQSNLLHRKLRSFRLLTASIFIVMVSGGALLQNVGRFQKAVEVVDGNATLRAVLFADDNNGKSGLEIRDPNSIAKLEMHTNKNDDPFVVFFDDNRKNRIELGIGENGDAYLLLRRGDGTIVHRLIAPN